MAGLNINSPDGLMRQLEQLAEVDAYAPRIIDAVLPTVAGAIRSGYGSHSVSGSLEGSVKVGKAKKNQYGYFGAVSPSGTDEKGVRNAEKAAYLEYGTSDQASTPVILPAVNSCESQVLETMQAEFDRMVGE